MNSKLHLLIATTLSMIMTFVLYCNLKGTRATGFIIPTISFDTARDRLLYIRCLANSEQIDNETCKYLLYMNEDDLKYLSVLIIILVIFLVWLGLVSIIYYIRSVKYTITGVWLLARFFENSTLWYEVDIFTVYLFIWQVMFVAEKWEVQEYPILSISLYRGWLCFLTACDAFLCYDTVFCYFSLRFKFLTFWVFSIRDICLHPAGDYYISPTIEKLSNNDISEQSNNDPLNPVQYYVTWNPDENQLDLKGEHASLGLGDFFLFNLMLLSVLPPLSSMKIQLCVVIGHIVAVQIGDEATRQLGRLCNRYNQPGLPLPVISVSLYAILLQLLMNS